MAKGRTGRKGKRKTLNTIKVVTTSPDPVPENDRMNSKPESDYAVSPSDLDVEASDTDHLNDLASSTDEENINEDLLKAESFEDLDKGTAAEGKNTIFRKKRRKKSKEEHELYDDSEYSSELDDVPKSFKNNLSSRNRFLEKENKQVRAELDSLRVQMAIIQDIPSLLTSVQNLISEVRSATADAANVRDEVKIAKTEAAIMRDEVKLANAQAVSLRQEIESSYQAITLFSSPIANIKEELTKANTQTENVRQELESAPIGKIKEDIKLATSEATSLHDEFKSLHETFSSLRDAIESTASARTPSSQKNLENAEQEITLLSTVPPCLGTATTDLSIRAPLRSTVPLSDVEITSAEESESSRPSSRCSVIGSSYRNKENRSPILISDESEDCSPIIETERVRHSDGQIMIKICTSTTGTPSNSQERLPPHNICNVPSLQATTRETSSTLNSNFDSGLELTSSHPTNIQPNPWINFPLDPNKLKEDYFDFGSKRVPKQLLKIFCHQKLSMLVSDLCRHLFSPTEMTLCSVFGSRRSNAYKHSFHRKALDAEKIDGIVDYIVLLSSSENRMEVQHQVFKAIKTKLGNFQKTEEAKTILSQYLTSIGVQNKQPIQSVMYP